MDGLGHSHRCPSSSARVVVHDGFHAASPKAFVREFDDPQTGKGVEDSPSITDDLEAGFLGERGQRSRADRLG